MKERDFDKILGEPKEAFVFLSDLSRDASHRLLYRVFAESQNMSVNEIPVGGEQGLGPILSFIPIAKDGFAQHLKSQEIDKSQIRDLLDITVPTNLSDMLSGLNIRLKARIETKNVGLAVYRHSLATFSVLSKARKVDSSNFKEGVVGTSYWPPKLDAEHVWQLLDEIETTTRDMIIKRDVNVNKESALRATHFFIVGGMLAKNYR